MHDKKAYAPPQIFRVELNHEQAVISSCSLSAANPMVGGGGAACRNGFCKNGSAGSGADNAARAS